MLCEHHINNTLSLQFATIIYLLADLNVERIKFQSASANLSRNYNAATMSKSLVFHCPMTERNETSERIEQFHGKEGFYHSTASLRFSLFWTASLPSRICSESLWNSQESYPLPKLISKVRGFTFKFCLKWSPRDFVSNFLQTPY